MKRPRSLNQSLNDVKYEQYVNNLHDRLPQLVDPSDIDCQRWPWELVQNAKDTVVKRANPEDRYVDVTIKYYTDSNGEKKLYFEHNGDQFTNKAITGLIWKFSAEKRNEQTTEDGLTRDKQSTGRFGTGFMTTHALSLTVDVSGSLLNDDPEINRNVSIDFTLHREGPDDAAYKTGVNLTESELDENMDKRPISAGEILPTRFTYHLNKEASEKAAKIGIDNVRVNAAQTMLFCPSVRSIKVIDDVNNLTFKITRQNNDGGKNVIKETKFIEESSDTDEPITRRFISTEIEEYSEAISSHWKAKDRNLRLHVAVEVDRDNNILPIPSTSPAVYCSLPLIGFESMSLPFYINSNDFEPATERTSLYLKKKRFEYRTNEDTGEEEIFYLQSGINWSIFERSLSLYEKIVDYLIDQDYNQRYNLINGLSDVLKGAWDTETKNCLASRFILPLRNMLAGKNLVKTEGGYRSIKSDVKFVECTKERDLHTLYSICKAVYGSNLAVEEENDKWVSLKWGCFEFNQDFDEKKPESENPAFPTIKYNKIAEFIENAGCLDNLQLILSDDNDQSLNTVEESNTLVKILKLEWLNKFYEWIEISKITNLSEKKIVPNRLGEFCSTEQGCDLKDASEISIAIFNFMKQIGLDWDKKLLMEGVRHITLTKVVKDNVITDIRERSKSIRDDVYDNNDNKLTKLLPILLALPLNENGRTEEFFKKRMQIVSILKVMYATKCEDKDSVTLDLKAETWEDTDKWFMGIVASALANRKHLDVLADDDTEEDKKAKYCTSAWLSETLNFMFQKSYLHQEDITSKEDKNDTLALIPNRYGEFKALNELCNQGQIPNQLLDDRLKETGFDIKESLLYDGFILSDKISISDYKLSTIAEKYNCFFDDEVGDNDKKEDVANYLIHLVPNCGDQFADIRKLYNECNNENHTIEDVPISDLSIWKGATKYLVNLLANKTSDWGSIELIGQHLELTNDNNRHKEKGVKWLNQLTDIITKNNTEIDNHLKLVPDWYGTLHCKNEMEYDGSKLLEYRHVSLIIDIIEGKLWEHFEKKEGDEELMSKIVHPEYINVKTYYHDTAEKVFELADRMIYFCSQNPVAYWREELKKCIAKLLQFFDENENKDVLVDSDLNRLFNETYHRRKELSYDFIYDAETKARISIINDSFTNEEIEELIKNPDIVKNILENKDYYQELKEENEELEKENESLRKQIEELKSLCRLSTVDDRKYANSDEGDWGEEIVWNDLQKKYPLADGYKVIWASKDEGKPCYDFRIERNNCVICYCDAKTTSRGLANSDSIPFFMRKSQWLFLNELDENIPYYIARVFIADNNQIRYLRISPNNHEKL